MRTTSSLTRAVVGLAAVLALSVAAPPAGAKTSECVEKPGPSPQRNVTLRELEASASKPTFSIGLKGKTERNGEVRLPVKGKQSVGKTARAASAVVIEKPSSKTDDLDATIMVAAAPIQQGRSVMVYACVTKAGRLHAGTFKGLVEVSGTRFRPFEYAIVVTQRWPFWIPLGFLGFLFVVVVVVEKLRSATRKGSWIVVAFIAGFLLGGTFFGQYFYNDTWGDNLPEQLAALITGATGAVASARLAATNFLTK